MALIDSEKNKTYINKYDKNIKMARKDEPLWKQLGFLSAKDFLITEASMGNPIAIKTLKDQKKKGKKGIGKK